MQIHFVSVKISIEWRAAALVEAERAMRLDYRIKRHDTQLVETGLTIEQHDVIVN